MYITTGTYPVSGTQIDFKNAECSACNNKSVDVRTEVLMPTKDSLAEGRIRKKIIFRCKEHIDCDVDEMERLTALKALKRGDGT